jgi:tetratricopeptide (TPR) repeat protein
VNLFWTGAGAPGYLLMSETKDPQNQPDPQRIEEITRIVLSVLDRWQQSQKKPVGWLSRSLGLVTKYWIILSALVLVVVGLWYQVSPFQEIERIHREQVQREFTRTMATRRLNLGNEFLDIGRYELAKQEFRKALRLDPTNVEVQLGLMKSEVYDMVEETKQGGKKAREYSPEVIDKRLSLISAAKPRDPHVQVMRGDMDYVKNKLDEAIKCYQKAIEFDPKVATAYFALGVIYDQKGQTEEARKNWEKAVSLSKDNTDYRNNLAYLYFEMGQYDKAIDSYQENIDRDPEFIISYLDRARVLRLTGNLEAAKQDQTTLIMLMREQRSDPLKKNQSPWYYPIKKGRDTVPVTLANFPEKEGYACYSLATTLYLLGHKSEARNLVSQAPRLRPEGQADVLALVDNDLNLLKEKQPRWSDLLHQFRQSLFSQFHSQGTQKSL